MLLFQLGVLLAVLAPAAYIPCLILNPQSPAWNLQPFVFMLSSGGGGVAVPSGSALLLLTCGFARTLHSGNCCHTITPGSYVPSKEFLLQNSFSHPLVCINCAHFYFRTMQLHVIDIYQMHGCSCRRFFLSLNLKFPAVSRGLKSLFYQSWNVVEVNC